MRIEKKSDFLLKNRKETVREWEASCVFRNFCTRFSRQSRIFSLQSISDMLYYYRIITKEFAQYEPQLSVL